MGSEITSRSRDGRRAGEAVSGPATEFVAETELTRTSHHLPAPTVNAGSGLERSRVAVVRNNSFRSPGDNSPLAAIIDRPHRVEKLQDPEQE